MDRVILYRKSVAIVNPVAARTTITDEFRVEKLRRNEGRTRYTFRDPVCSENESQHRR